MKFCKFSIMLLICFGLLSWATAVTADDPPKSPNDAVTQVSTPPTARGSFDPTPIQETKDVLDRSTASVTQLQLAEDHTSLVIPSSAPSTEAPPPPKGSFAPGPIQLAEFSRGGVFKVVPGSANTANDLLLGQPAQLGPTGEIGAASSTLIKFENFEGSFPNTWARLDNNGATGGNHLWGKVNCFPIESGGVSSAWPAFNGANGVNPCPPTSADYPPNVDSWLSFGPFSLADAQSATLDFYFRNVSESNDDAFRWLASINDVDYYGFQISGTHTSGPFNNGYNFISFDLTNVPTLGNLAGQPQVWIAFRFVSDADATTAQGPFIDSIMLRKNTDPRVYVTNENFDLADFPNAFWDSFDDDGATNGDFHWDDVPCFSRSGSWSMWPANEGANALNPCSPDLNSYPNNAKSWLIHGPFSLVGASEAWVDFNFRLQSETCCDKLFWGVSLNGANFFGQSLGGTYTGGPEGNGYNRTRFDLSDVFNLGDLRGQPAVWLAFVFTSDDTTIGQGPFIDDVSIVIEKIQAQPGITQLFLPVIIKTEIALAKVYITNNTGGNLTYQIFGTPQGAIVCNVPTGAQNQQCGVPFTPNTYNWRADARCGSKTGTKFFNSGDNYPKPFSC